MFKAFNVRTENLFIDKPDNEPYRKVIETDYAFDVESGFGIIPGAAASFFEKSSRTEFGGKYAQGINHTSYRRPLFPAAEFTAERFDDYGRGIYWEHPYRGVACEFFVFVQRGAHTGPEHLHTPAGKTA